MRKSVTRAVLNGLAAMVLVLGAGAAQALNVISIGDTAIGIDDLLIPGGDPAGYDVVFRFTSGAEVYGDPPTFFWTSQAEAETAAEAINTALTDDGIMAVGTSSSSFYQIAFDLGMNPGDVRYTAGFNNQGFWTNIFVPLEKRLESSAVWADFTVVPEPGTALLLGLGLTGLGIAVRRRPPAA